MDLQVGHYSARQIAVYKYWNTWLSTSFGASSSIYKTYNSSANDNVSNTTDSRAIKKAAENYANGKDSSYQVASVKNNNGNISATSDAFSNGIVGPFKVTYTGTPSVTVYNKSGNTVSYTICNSSGAAMSLSSGTSFYIKLTSESIENLAKLRVTASGASLKTTIYFMRGYNSGGSERQKLIAVDSSTTTSSDHVDIDINITPVGNLKVIKRDSETSTNMAGMTFKVRTNSGWLQSTSSGYVYNASFANATTYTISNASGLTISNLITSYTYQVWETGTPNADYILSDQEGYDSTLKAVNLTGDNWITLIKNTTVTKTYTNWARVISISGYVWVDDNTKDDEWNSKYDEGETLVEGVTVKLINKNTGDVLATTTTDSEGKYIFEDVIRYREAKNYYVSFDYSSYGTDYITVAFNSETANSIVDNGSRAIASSVAESDNDLTGLATTYTGVDSSKETTYGLSGNLYTALFNEENLTLEYINLGIKPIYDPDYKLTETLEYVKIVLDGYTYTYEYGAGTELKSEDVPKVSFQDGTGDITLYTRYFYPSAIYTLLDEDENNDLEVYVVYSITITNMATYEEEELYVENNLCITSLTNKFDTDRYTLETKYTDTTNTSIEGVESDFGKWTVNGNTATYADSFKVNKGETEQKYIEFKVNDDAITEILAHPEGIYEEYPTTAYTTGYHNFTRKDYSWSNNISATQNHTSKSKDKQSSAPYLVFMLPEDDNEPDRTISGYVFEDTDTDTTNDSALGDGIYDESESAVSGVTVTLLDASDSSLTTLASMYSDETTTDDDGNVVYKLTTDKSTYTTGDSGYYEFVGVLPGEYVICLTYGDGTQYIVVDNEAVSLDDYKSTIVTSEVAKNALGYDTNSYGDEWYKYLEGTNYSVAVDDLDLRSNYNDGDTSITNMLAETATINITIENTTDETTSDGNTLYEEIFTGFNLGIIKQPEQTVDVEKIITNVKLINTPTTIFDGNPETDDLTGVSDLDGSTNGGSSYTRVEIEEDSIYGSELTLEYTIKITNTSDENYYETDEDYYGWYYMFGDVVEDVSEEVQLSAEEVADYLDEYLNYSLSSSNVTVVEKEETDEEGYTTLTVTGLESIKRTSTESFTIEAYKILSTSDDDLAYTNIADVKTLINVVAGEDEDNEVAIRSLKLVKAPELPEPDEAYITISPPTGADRVTIIMYVIAGLTMLVVLSIGVVIIKKRVL